MRVQRLLRATSASVLLTSIDFQSHSKGYLLMTSDDDFLPKNEMQVPNANLLDRQRTELFVSGDNRANVQPGLLALHVIWHREHNLNCDEILKQSPALDDEAVFQQARALTIAKWQAIVYEEFLPALVGPEGMKQIKPYSGYSKSVDITVANEFATAAFRYGHSQVGEIFKRYNADGTG